ncbi:MAG: hypothetical protein ACYTGL_18675 [Planctomycetota bacterium]
MNEVARWLKAGCQEVRVVDGTDGSIATHRSATDVTCVSGDDTLRGSLVLPGFQVKLTAVFPVCG